MFMITLPPTIPLCIRMLRVTDATRILNLSLLERTITSRSAASQHLVLRLSRDWCSDARRPRNYTLLSSAKSYARRSQTSHGGHKSTEAGQPRVCDCDNDERLK